MVGNLEIGNPIASIPLLCNFRKKTKKKPKKKYELQRTELRKKLGDSFEFVEIGDAATFDGLTKELETKNVWTLLIEKCIKRLLLVRGA